MRVSNGLIGVILLAGLLTGCGGGEGDDLDQFMANAANDMSKNVPPLPEVKPYSPLQYNADGALSEPFRARKVVGASGGLQPNLNRPRESLEAFPLESLKYVGMLKKGKNTHGLVKKPDNTIEQVKVGNYMGPNYGLVMAINEGVIELKELVQDDTTGDWVERSASLNLQE